MNLTAPINSPHAFWLFGSHARGNPTHESDIDVLVVIKQSHPINKSEVDAHFKRQAGSMCSVSFYSAASFDSNIREGKLFTHHIHREARPLNKSATDYFNYQTPSSSPDIYGELSQLTELLHSIPAPPWKENIVFDSGLLYVFLRNYATAAWWLADRKSVDFSRHSPITLSQHLHIQSPANTQELDALASCRHARNLDLSPTLLPTRSLSNIFLQTEVWRKAINLNFQIPTN